MTCDWRGLCLELDCYRLMMMMRDLRAVTDDVVEVSKFRRDRILSSYVSLVDTD